MANIKISELNALTERADNDLLAIVDTSADETKKIQVSDLVNKNIELIAVSDTAPSECSIGDKYYNTSTKLIYTATAQDTWSETGTTPISGILYILTTDQRLYNYDGTDLVMVGGAGSIVHNNYSESTTEPYSANYVNNAIPTLSNQYGTSQTDGYSQRYFNNITNNLFITEGATSGYYLNNSGEEASNSNWSYTDYISIVPNKQYSLSKNGNSLGNNPSICFYDSSKNFISGIAYGGSLNKIITTPNNAKYVRISYSNTEISSYKFVLLCFNDNYYSDEEQVIGVYSNGKPIYRKTFIGTYNNNATLISNISVLVNAYGAVRISSVERAFPYFEYYNNTAVYQGTLQLNDSHQIKTVFTSDNSDVSASIHLTLEYTKTTD